MVGGPAGRAGGVVSGGQPAICVPFDERGAQVDGAALASPGFARASAGLLRWFLDPGQDLRIAV